MVQIKFAMENSVKAASERFNQHYSCSQSVFSAFAPRFSLDEEQALKLASPFGGGVAHQGNVCGAVTGALMPLGLACGNATIDKKDETHRVAEEYLKRFRERYDTILCRELIRHDISTTGGMQNARDAGVFKSICPGLVKSAAELLDEMLKE